MHALMYYSEYESVRVIMQCISRKEQELIKVKLEEDFDVLVRKVNQKLIMTECAISQAEALVEEIRTINKNRFFEEDLRQFLDDFSAAIESYIQKNLYNSTYNSAALFSYCLPIPPSAALHLSYGGM